MDRDAGASRLGLDFPPPHRPNLGVRLLLALPIAETQPWVWPGIFGILGLVVGSFLNVAIYRLPREGTTVWNPRRSHCPRCGHALSWVENLPVLSWLALRGRCRACRGRISVRYPLVELLTGASWALAASRAPTLEVVLVHVLVLSGLIVATFVDFDCFEIPDEVSIGGMVAAPLCSLLVPAIHDRTWLAHALSEGPGLDRGGALLASLAGMAVGAGVLLAIGWLGKRAFGRDAMGLGDVKLLGAAGGFIGPGGVLLALFLGSLAASVVGVGNIARFYCLIRSRARRRGVRKPPGAALARARVAGRYLPFGPYLSLGVGIVLLGWEDVVRLLAEFAP